ncbi:MAG: CLI_3235 family bacteriocin precursor [Lachnospiraceae bacterium]|nr:CLI_3235 family bacteriocin precursor [Lachnospiraceae bacterium]
MRKVLGKKNASQSGTVVAFACDCISVCQSSAFCNCTTTAAQSNTYATSMGKIVATALSGSNFMWG